MAVKTQVAISIDPAFKLELSTLWLRRVEKSILEAASAPKAVEVSLLITSDETVQDLNRYYRDEDHTTDVLAFALSERDETSVEFRTPPDGLEHLGEVVISYPQAARQANEHKHSVKSEIALLMTHGTLHLLGYDHGLEEEAGIMRAKEKAVMLSLESLLA